MAWTQELQDAAKAAADANDLAALEDALTQLECGGPTAEGITLEKNQMSRFLGLIGAPASKGAGLFEEALGASRRQPPFVYTAEVLAILDKNRAKSRAVGKVSRARKAALATADDGMLQVARAHEARALEVARANEALAKSGVVPKWSARSYRATANAARAQRIVEEGRVLARTGGHVHGLECLDASGRVVCGR